MQGFKHFTRSTYTTILAMTLLLGWQSSSAGPLRERFMERSLARQGEANATSPVARLDGGRLIQDVPYGEHAKQRMDIYLPRQAAGAPVIFMVHGGAWRFGDKGAGAVIDHKVAHWVTQGLVFISINYRLLPDTPPVEQAQDVARALAAAQRQAASWGADPAKFILMGHSAGAHLLALLSAAPAKALQLGARPWLGTVLLDSAALDVVKIMQSKHPRFYDRAFGSDPAYWRAASPLQALAGNASPLLAVCSTRRDDSCDQAQHFVARANALDGQATVLQQDLSHKGINQQLGLPSDYTAAVDAFMGALDPSVMQALTHNANAAAY